MQLRTAMLFVKDLPRMRRFYAEALGLTELPERQGDGWAEFAAGGVTLGLHAIPPHIAADIAIGDPPTAREDTPIKLVFACPDVAAARLHLAAHGAVMFELRPWGTCDGLDPEGNVFQIAPAN